MAWGEIIMDSDSETNHQMHRALSTHLTTLQNFFQPLLRYLNRQRSPVENILLELGNVRKSVVRESNYFKNPLVDEESKRKRLNFLFVKDLLDGVNGMILDTKDQRDTDIVGQVPLWHKVLAALFLCISSLGMLYYVYLFAMNQSASRQRGWFNSFQVWLFFEIFIVSTGLVLVEHVFIPLWSFREVQRVKEKIVGDILTFQKKLKQQRKVNEKNGCNKLTSISEEGTQYLSNQLEYDHRSFNAAEYLYPSHRLAQLFPNYPESELILQYKTLWPKKSFKHGEKSMKKKYDKRFEFLTRTIARVGIFAVTSVVQLPPAIQDMGIQMLLFTVVGYLFRLHVRLYEISPILVIFPSLLIWMLAYLCLVSKRRINTIYQTHPIANEEENVAINDSVLVKGDSRGLDHEEDKSNEIESNSPTIIRPARRDQTLQDVSLARDIVNQSDNEDDLRKFGECCEMHEIALKKSLELCDDNNSDREQNSALSLDDEIFGDIWKTFNNSLQSNSSEFESSHSSDEMKSSVSLNSVEYWDDSNSSNGKSQTYDSESHEISDEDLSSSSEQDSWNDDEVKIVAITNHYS